MKARLTWWQVLLIAVGVLGYVYLSVRWMNWICGGNPAFCG